MAARKAACDDSPSYPPLTPGLSGDEHRPPARPGPLDHRPRQPADRPRGRQPDLDAALRHAPGPDRVRLRPQRQAADPSPPCSTGWPSSSMDQGWQHEADPPPDRHQRRLPDAVGQRRTERPEPRPRPGERVLLADEPKRMEAEAVRDNLLHVAGSLDRTMGGPDLDPEAGLSSPRRSLYFRHAKEKRVTFLRLFDSANVLSCYRRTESVVPQQALALANSSLSLDQARRLAKRLLAEQARADPLRPRRRPRSSPRRSSASSADRRRRRNGTTCDDFLREADRSPWPTGRGLTPFCNRPAAAVPPAADPAQRAARDLVHVLLNHNDFVTIR